MVGQADYMSLVCLKKYEYWSRNDSLCALSTFYIESSKLLVEQAE